MTYSRVLRVTLYVLAIMTYLDNAKVQTPDSFAGGYQSRKNV